MTNRLGSAVSPYLRSHADNPVDWFEWGEDAFAEAERRQVPVFISIGYSTCHWCHVMARESFSDPALARDLNDRFVAIKVDREEHPDVDATYLAAAGAFTDQLGWPLSVFATPGGRAFFAGTYFPPEPIGDRASFRQVLDAVTDAWTDRHAEVEDTADRLAAAIAASAATGGSHGTDAGQGERSPGEAEFGHVVSELAGYEDEQYGGFGGAPKFPIATTLLFLLDRADLGDTAAGALANRSLDAMAASELRDPVEGGFFRYATRRDWTEPHYERMLYDNALLLDAYARAGRRDTAEGIAGFLLGVLRVGDGFASAQDSESTVDGERVEGGYYQLDAAGRARQQPPAVDEKILTGWNGLAIGAVASAGARLGREDWVTAAVEIADAFASGPLERARIGDRASTARPTLEDFGMLAAGLVDLALATGESRFAVRARQLVEDCLVASGPTGLVPFAVPGGADPVLAARGLALEVDPSEGAYPSGLSAMARAATRLSLLGAGDDLRVAAMTAMDYVSRLAIERPISFGSTLGVMSLLRSSARQLVVVTDDLATPLAQAVRDWSGARGVAIAVTTAQAEAWSVAGFELFDGRAAQNGLPTAYLCEDFVCALPVTEPAALAALL